MSTRICIPIRKNSLAALFASMREASSKADLVELWLGEFPVTENELSLIFQEKQTPLVLTIKRKEAGGSFSGTEEEMLDILLQGSGLGAEYVDLDSYFPEKLIKKFLRERGKTDLILSAHFFTSTPGLAELVKLAESMKMLGADIVKIATFANTESDSDVIFALTNTLRKMKLRFITLAMGEAGKGTRILTPLMGSEWMFASLSDEEGTAPGQMTSEDLRLAWKNLLEKMRRADES